MKKKISLLLIVLLTLPLFVAFAGCSQNNDLIELHDPLTVAAVFDETHEEFIDITPEMVPLTATPAIFTIPVPAAPGTSVKKNEKALIDYSNGKDGYVMIKFIPDTKKIVKVIIKGPSEAQYQYNLKPGDIYEVFPLSDGNGTYTVGVYEQAEGSKFATVLTASIDVKLNDEFAPFLRPNQYVNYNKDSQTVKKAAELVKDAKTLMAKVTAIYNFVIKNLEYDREKAQNVKSGYLPDVDAVLRAGKGICFDYAAVMAAMLRSQGIPTKLVVGFTGDIYHAWLSVHSSEAGWVNSVIQFDGKSWKLMDPTFASTGSSSAEIMKYIGDGKNYTAKFIY
jgi:hypothetical protein